MATALMMMMMMIVFLYICERHFYDPQSPIRGDPQVFTYPPCKLRLFQSCIESLMVPILTCRTITACYIKTTLSLSLESRHQSRMAFEKIGSPPAQSLNIVYLIGSTRVALSSFPFVEIFDTKLYYLLIGRRIHRLRFLVKMGSMLSTKLTYNYLHSTPQPSSICNNCFAWSRS